MRSSLGKFLAVLTLTSLTLALAHCGRSYGDFCKKERDCRGGNDKDEDACEERLSGESDQASAYGCGDSWDKYADCLESNATCRELLGVKAFDTGCGAQRVSLESCEMGASAVK